MQLGTRWAVGAAPPDRLPDVMVAAIADVESEVAATDGLDITGWRWTLTWLEGRPIAQLDDGTTLRYDPSSDTVGRTETE